MLNDRTLKTAFIISLTGHLLILRMPWVNMNSSPQDQIEDIIIVNIEIERPPLIPRIDTMGEEKKLKEIIGRQKPPGPEPEIEPELQEIVMEEPIKEAMLRYQDMVKQRIESARRYPSWAKRQGIEGTAYISFTVLSNGLSKDIKIVRSSGSKILDEEAVKNVKRANPFPSIPADIGTFSIQMQVSIVYTLK